MAISFVRASNAHREDDLKRLSAFYPNAAYDFYGTPSSPLCVYKSGHPWHVNTGIEAWRVIREARPVRYDHPIQAIWPDIGKRLHTLLDDKKVRWTSIDPVAFADTGEKRAFCPLLFWIGVEPASLGYEDAQTAAEAATFLLTSFGLDGFEIGFRESIVTRSCSSDNSSESADPIFKIRKPFTPILGLPISSSSTQLEGTGALYLRESEDSDRIYLLTCSHIVRLPSDTGPANRKNLHEKVSAPGPMGYSHAIGSIEQTIKKAIIWADAARSNGRLDFEADKAKRKAGLAQDLHEEVTKRWGKPEARVIGEVAYAPPISVNSGYTEDWALVELDNDKFDLTPVKGNQVYIDKDPLDYVEMMYPNSNDKEWDSENFVYPENGLLQASTVLSADEIRRPQHLDENGDNCLFVTKNGLVTGTTFGCSTGMESIVRNHYEGFSTTTNEIAILPYNYDDPPFSSCPIFSVPGDSGSIVLARDGRIVGMITGGAASGSAASTDVTYLTPFWLILEQIRTVFPNCCLYQAANTTVPPS